MRFSIIGSKDTGCVGIDIVDSELGDDEGYDLSLIILDRDRIAFAEGMEIMKDGDVAIFPYPIVSGYDCTARVARYRPETKP